MQYLDIQKELIPYTFNILLDGELFDFRIDYNNKADFFTVSLSKNGVALCDVEPIIYGYPLFGDLKNRGDFPNVTIIPMDESRETDAVTFDNLSSTVFLVVSGGGVNE